MDPVTKSRKTAESSEKNREQRLRNLKPFEKGKSGNPGGRPKKKPQTEIYEEIYADPKMRAAIKQQTFQTMAGKGMAGVLERREAAERTEGKVTQQVEMEVTGKLTLEAVLEARKKAGK